MTDLPERGTPEYLEHVEAALCLAFTTLAMVAAAPLRGAVQQTEIKSRSVLIVNDLAPLVDAIMEPRGVAERSRADDDCRN